MLYDSITGVIRTDGPVITFNGAWAQNIGEVLPSNIDITIKTAEIMEGIYQSAKLHKEVEL